MVARPDHRAIINFPSWSARFAAANRRTSLPRRSRTWRTLARKAIAIAASFALA